MESLIRLCGCTSKSSLDAYDILLLLFVCCSSDYYVVYTINGRICRLFFLQIREREMRGEREMLFLFYQRLFIPAFYFILFYFFFLLLL